MYNFYFGSRDEIEKDPRSYLVAIKHSLPRWANSLPDSEYYVLMDLIESMNLSGPPTFVETGIGATTILFIHYAMQSGGKVFSWDMNSSKASFIRSVCADTLEMYHKKPISDHWTFVSSDTLSPHTGISIAGELTARVHLSHHDSDHTWDTIRGEISALLPLFEDGAIVCVDDVNQDYQHVYEPILNITRRKLGLNPIRPIAGNRAEPHHAKIPALLAEKFDRIEEVGGAFKSYLNDDLFYAWYETDRRNMSTTNMERMDTLEKRFAAWRISGKK